MDIEKIVSDILEVMEIETAILESGVQLSDDFLWRVAAMWSAHSGARLNNNDVATMLLLAEVAGKACSK